MSQPIVLTPHQGDAINATLDRLAAGTPLCAIRGLAGTGKTTLIPHLRQVITDSLDKPTAVGSPTHRASMILRKKGISDASTIHSLALTPYFEGDYAWAHRWLGEDCPARAGAIEERTPDVDRVPFLLHKAVERTAVKAKTLMTRARTHGAKKALESIGIHGKQYFSGFGPKAGEGVLLVDEASMVGEQTLALCLEAFPQVVLIGDHGQLPPVKDHAQLGTVEGFALTEIHRQAADSPIIQLAYAARLGQQNWRAVQTYAGQIDEYHDVDASAFLTSPLLVWRNNVREAVTRAIRAQLGYHPEYVSPGEPLMCRATSAADRADGFVNNSNWRVVETSKKDPRRVTVHEEGCEQIYDVLLHLEELDGDDIDPDSVPFRFGYAMTVHTAQGGEWPTVYISKPELLAYEAVSKKRQSDDHTQWTYTAITRAKTLLGFLTQHSFLGSMKGTAVPVTMEVPNDAPANDPVLIVEDPNEADVPDPVVPAAALDPLDEIQYNVSPAMIDRAMAAAEPLPPTVPPIPENLIPLAHGFCQYLQAQFGAKLEESAIRMTKEVSTTVDGMLHYAQGVLQNNEHVGYQLSDALLKVLEGGIKIVRPNYQLVIHAVTPAGLPLTLTVTKDTSAELVEELGRLEGWLGANGYTALAAVAA